MIPDLKVRNPGLVEWMDRDDCNPRMLRNTYRYFPVINRMISRWKAVYNTFIRPLLTEDRTYHLLDVGSGGGDITRNIWWWAKRDGYHLDVTGIDPDPRALEYSRRQYLPGRRVPDSLEADPQGSQPSTQLNFLPGRTRDLCQKNETFDFVVCNHVLHHLSDTEVRPFLNELQQLATHRIICSDIERSSIGYLLFYFITWPLFPDSYIRTDGLLSIRKSFSLEELRQLVPDHWSVQRQFPYRLIVIGEPAATKPKA